MTHANWETTAIPMRKTIEGVKTTDVTDVLLADVPPIPVGKNADNSCIVQTAKDVLNYFLRYAGGKKLHRQISQLLQLNTVLPT